MIHLSNVNFKTRQTGGILSMINDAYLGSPWDTRNCKGRQAVI